MTGDKELATGVRKELLTPDARGHCSLILWKDSSFRPDRSGLHSE
jgi:hypothetical protein